MVLFRPVSAGPEALEQHENITPTTPLILEIRDTARMQLGRVEFSLLPTDITLEVEEKLRFWDQPFDGIARQIGRAAALEGAGLVNKAA